MIKDKINIVTNIVTCNKKKKYNKCSHTQHRAAHPSQTFTCGKYTKKQNSQANVNKTCSTAAHVLLE